jgi:hypothetical protein
LDVPCSPGNIIEHRLAAIVVLDPRDNFRASELPGDGVGESNGSKMVYTDEPSSNARRVVMNPPYRANARGP